MTLSQVAGQYRYYANALGTRGRGILDCIVISFPQTHLAKKQMITMMKSYCDIATRRACTNLHVITDSSLNDLVLGQKELKNYLLSALDSINIVADVPFRRRDKSSYFL